MSNEVALRDSGAIEDYRTSAVRRLGEWAESARAAHEVATQLVQTSFVPEAFRGNAGEATAAILAGSEVGLSPMAALRSFDIIQGTAAPRAITLRAVVQSFGHEIILDESTSTRCVMRGRRRGSQEWQKVVWTLDRAKQLGLVGKHNWKAQPQAMLIARATSETCRLIAADAILGIGYTVEEIADGADVDVQVDPPPPTTAAPSGTRRMSRRKAAEPAPAADADPPSDDAQPDHDETRRRRMHALFTERGITTHEQRVGFAATAADRELESTNDLTPDERETVISFLERGPADAPADPTQPETEQP